LEGKVYPMLGPCSWLHQASSRWPGKEAILDEETSLGFEALYQAALQTGCWLRTKGKTGERVVIALPSGVPETVLYFGTQFAGMVAVPLNPSMSFGQLEALIKEIDPCVVVGPSDLKPAGELLEFFPVDSYRNFQEILLSFAGVADLPEVQDDPFRLLNIVYTSGTTGKPKGVMLNGANLEAVILGIQKTLAIKEDHKIFTALPFAHTYGLSQLWLMAKAGASLAVVPDITRMAAIRKTIVERNINVIAGVPYHFALFARRGEKEKWDRIRMVTVAGDGPSKSLIQKMKVSFPNAGIIVMYGLTEATTRLTVLPSEDLDRKEGSIGLPMEGVELRVIDEKGSELGPHQEGELIARGSNIFPGYWRDEELTRKALINGWLHTGDIVRKDEDGYFYHLGRKDLVFKSGGEKIDPEAIEKVLLDIEGVRDAAVLGREDLYRGKSICAVVVKEGNSNLAPGKIISECQDKLDRLWVPNEVVFVEEIPRTSNGKIRYDVLREKMSVGQ